MAASWALRRWSPASVPQGFGGAGLAHRVPCAPSHLSAGGADQVLTTTNVGLISFHFRGAWRAIPHGHPEPGADRSLGLTLPTQERLPSQRAGQIRREVLTAPLCTGRSAPT